MIVNKKKAALLLGMLSIASTVAACGGGTGMQSPRVTHQVMIRCTAGSTTAAGSVVTTQCRGALVQGHASGALLTASKPAYSGSFVASTTKAGVVALSQAASNQFVVTPLAVGSTTLEIADAQGDKVTMTLENDDIQCEQDGQFAGSNAGCTVVPPSPSPPAPSPSPSR